MSDDDGQREISRLITAMQGGDRSASDRVWALIYPALLSIARRQLAGDRLGVAMQPASLVSECYLRVSHAPASIWADRTRFMTTAASIMRHILTDRARAYGARKRGGASRDALRSRPRLRAPRNTCWSTSRCARPCVTCRTITRARSRSWSCATSAAWT